MSGGPSRHSEYTVRIPKRDTAKRYSILKFNGSLRIDVGKWGVSDCSVRMNREDNQNQTVGDSRQEYGEGTEFGKALREEARRKKYGLRTRTYRHDDQPWVLSIASGGKERKFRSIREGGAGEHADYWIFLKAGDEFHAHKVDEWYQFLPSMTYRTLDADQAEERFRERNRVMNQFALKAQIQQQLKAMDEDGEQMIRTTRSLKIKDEASSDENSEGEKGDDEDESPKIEKTKKKIKNVDRMRKDKRQRVENSEDVAAYESDDGDDEGREYDYMSDSGSESDRDVIPMEQKVDEAMVAVGDEAGLKQLIGGDLSDSEDSDVDDTNSSGSDSDDPDKEITSAIFLPVKKAADESSSRKRPADETLTGDTKRAKTDQLSDEAPPTSSAAPVHQDGLNEETVRRYLRRKPHTTKELLSRIKSKCGDMAKSEIVQKLAAILKRIEPHQFKQRHGKRDVLFFTLTNNLA